MTGGHYFTTYFEVHACHTCHGVCARWISLVHTSIRPPENKCCSSSTHTRAGTGTYQCMHIKQSMGGLLRFRFRFCCRLSFSPRGEGVRGESRVHQGQVGREVRLLQVQVVRHHLKKKKKKRQNIKTRLGVFAGLVKADGTLKASLARARYLTCIGSKFHS